MQIKFWGVRGSLPAPVSSERIAEKLIRALNGAKGVDLDDVFSIQEYVDSLPFEIRGTCGGNTSCVEILANGHRLIFDAGSGLRELGLQMMKEEFGQGQGEAHLFISHTHWDHIQGFPYFVPAYIPGNKIHIYSPKLDIQQKFATQQMDQDMFPMRLDDMSSDKEFITMPEDGVEIGDIRVDCLLLHHPGGSWAYRVRAGGKTLVYATDGEYQDLSQEALQPYLDFFADADALIFDSMYTFSESVSKEGWGHSTSLVGVDLSVKTGVKRLILFHHEPTYDDNKLAEIMQKTSQYYSLVREFGQLEILLAMEGEVIEI
jgi:phosphoribosyl 1,2-cyclic phosphodiesterase